MTVLSNNKTITIVSLTAFIIMMMRVIYFFVSEDKVLVGVIPDDAFYYLQLAKNKVALGRWTFDRQTTCTGFHLLYGYILTLLYSIDANIGLHCMFLIISLLSTICITISLALICIIAKELFGQETILLAASPFFAPITILQSTVMVESFLVILLASLALYSMINKNKCTVATTILLIALGLLGSLARSDFGLLPGAMFIVLLLGYRTNIKTITIRCGWLLVGAVLGVALILLHNYIVSGHLTQASAQTKLYWSSTIGHSFLPPFYLVTSIIAPFIMIINRYVKIFALVIIAILLARFVKNMIDVNYRTEHKHQLLYAGGCLLVVIGYMVFYRFNSQAISVWYSANLIAPLAVIFAASGCFLFRPKVKIVAGGVFLFFLVFSVVNSFNVPWPYQAGMMNAGLFLKKMDSTEKIGTWNAGLVSYFSGKGIINLDGLTNDEVLPYIKNNALLDYIKEKKIKYLADYQRMLTREKFKKMGGYADNRLERCLKPIHSNIDGKAEKWSDSRIVLYEVLEKCP